MKNRLFYILIIFLFLFILIGCKEKNNQSDTPDTVKYKLTIIDNESKIEQSFEYDKSSIKISELKVNEKNGYLFIGWSIDGKNVYNQEELNIINNDTIYSLWEKENCLEDIFSVGTIGRVEIFVNEEITSKNDYVSGKVSISKDDYKIEKVNADIRLRGNSSLNAPKKSYKIKFDKKQDVFGFGSDKEWALIANYYDPSLIRNFYAYRLAQAMGVLATIDCCFVEVYLNGQYNGLYLFCETVKTGTNRINIEIDYDENEYDIPFLLELDYKMISDGDPDSNGVENVDFFYLDMRSVNNKNYPIATKYPKTYEKLTSKQFKFIRDYLKEAYDSVTTEYYDLYFDIPSVIDYFFIEELTMNVDVEHSSVFFYREKGGKITYGPVWDFDISSGNANYVSNYKPTTLMKNCNGGNYIFNKLLKQEAFKESFIARMNEIIETILPTMFASFETNYNVLLPYEQKDEMKWHYLNKSFWPKPDYLIGITYYEQVEYVKNYLQTHIDTMKAQIK